MTLTCRRTSHNFETILENMQIYATLLTRNTPLCDCDFNFTVYVVMRKHVPIIISQCDNISSSLESDSQKLVYCLFIVTINAYSFMKNQSLSNILNTTLHVVIFMTTWTLHLFLYHLKASSKHHSFHLLSVVFLANI